MLLLFVCDLSLAWLLSVFIFAARSAVDYGFLFWSSWSVNAGVLSVGSGIVGVMDVSSLVVGIGRLGCVSLLGSPISVRFLFLLLIMSRFSFVVV